MVSWTTTTDPILERKMARPDPPKPAELNRVFHDSVAYEIVHTFGIADGLDPEAGNHAIAETVNFARYCHARVLCDSLLLRADPRKLRPDDVVAEDYGVDPVALCGSEDERKRLLDLVEVNKGLFHLTAWRVSPSSTKPWSQTILGNLLTPTIRFMEAILR